MKYSRCPIRHVLSLFSDKWSLLVLCHMYTGGTMRFGELASAITDISERMLISMRLLHRAGEPNLLDGFADILLRGSPLDISLPLIKRDSGRAYSFYIQNSLLG